MPFAKLIICYLLFLVSPVGFALNDADLLPPDKAFKVSAKALSADQLEVTWVIAEGFSVHRNHLRLTSKNPPIVVGQPDFPTGLIKHDELLGDVEYYHKQLKIHAPLTGTAGQSSLQLFVQFQACADQGICYPPQKLTLPVPLPAAKPAAVANPLSGLLKAGGFKLGGQTNNLLPPDQAFQFFAEIKDANTLQISWNIAEDYYLYRDKIRLELLDSRSVSLAGYDIPHGSSKPLSDEEGGTTEIFREQIGFDVPLIRTSMGPQTIRLKASFQGCADRGVCYPPMAKILELPLPATSTLGAALAKPNAPISEQDQIVKSLHQDNFGVALVSFFGFGLLLSLTPCIFPMIPILSGIIVGHGHKVTTMRAFSLSLSYVLASALTYTAFGVLAALFGSNLQATFQQPWIIVLFSAVFVLLSLSMFGFYHLELPKSLQAKLHNSSEKHRDGSLWGAAIMGSLSSLIVGPCVAAPLAGALIYIGQTGDALLGGAALFTMGLGMGVPLLLLGASAGKLLPKAGDWLNDTKAVFGVIMLTVAVWMLSRVIPPAATMLLYTMLLILPSVYLRAIDPLPEPCTGWQKLWKGLGIMMLAYGLLLLFGLGMGNDNPLRPLQGLSASRAQATEPEGLRFETVASLAELEAKVQAAAAANKPVMLDFYADWCVSCKEMEAYTFTDPDVKKALARFVLLRADVTKNTIDDQALLGKFNLIGPPGVLFFNTDGREQIAQRVIGYQDTATFLATLKQLAP